jgi:hypothetical protein
MGVKSRSLELVTLEEACDTSVKGECVGIKFLVPVVEHGTEHHKDDGVHDVLGIICRADFLSGMAIGFGEMEEGWFRSKEASIDLQPIKTGEDGVADVEGLVDILAVFVDQELEDAVRGEMLEKGCWVGIYQWSGEVGVE